MPASLDLFCSHRVNLPIMTILPTQCAAQTVVWTDTAQLMAIVNATPDSFSDGGALPDAPDDLANHLAELVAAGATWLDVGAESSRPGSQRITAEEEWHRLKRVLPLAVATGAFISVDTYKGDVAERSLAMGAHLINDITAGQDPQLLEVVAQHRAGFA